MSIKSKLVALAAILTVSGSVGFATIAEAGGHDGAEHNAYHPARQSWTFGGIFGKFDRAQLRRGYQIYDEVCSACHSMKLMSYRNLMESGGPEFTKDEVKKMIADKAVPAEPNDEGATYADGERITRPALLTDRFVSPYENDKAAMAANGGALPPDLSVMAKARSLPHAGSGKEADNIFFATVAGIKEYAGWVFGVARDIVTQYQEGGPDYIYALMTSYEEEVPEGAKPIPEDKNFNHIFPGNAISMAPPLSDETVEYADGTKPTLDQHARDIATFLMWVAEPKLEERKRTGFMALVYLFILSMLMYMVKRAIWSGQKH